MDALIPPKKRKRARARSNRHLPSELIEEILLNLPQKSLVRFSTVSKSWNSMIFDPVFARKHKNRAALLFRHRLVVHIDDYSKMTSRFLSLPPTSSDLRLELIKKRHLSSDGTRSTEHSFSVFSDRTSLDVRDFSGQFKGVPHVLAYCDELWCVEVSNSIFLWNPSMRNIVELPPPLFKYKWYGYVDFFIYGLAYDSVNDDYKILKIETSRPYRTELYSLKSKCWREIKSFSIPHREDDFFGWSTNKCKFVDGRFHWLRETILGAPITIAFFDLSTEMYGEVALPEYVAGLDITSCSDVILEVVALRGMLCASLVEYCDVKDRHRFVLLVMEEYGVEKSWTKRFDIPLSSPLTGLKITPFYLSDNNDILVKRYEHYGDNYTYIFMFRNGEANPKQMVKFKCGDGSGNFKIDALLYVESLFTHKNFLKNG